MVRMVFGAVRHWSPEDWPVPSHCAQGLGPSRYHALQFVGARDLVSPTFGFLLPRLAFFFWICCLINQVVESFINAERWVLGSGLYIWNIVFGHHFFSCSLVIFLK